jgi:2-keto-4-pentenoate hydratase/2-oxohepta-3-ene-1,7-dioic acid hydratase in catechol pathway
MKLATFTYRNIGDNRVGVVIDKGIVDITAFNSNVAANMKTLLEHGNEGLSIVKQAIKHTNPIPLNQICFKAPVPNPRLCLALGGNYPSHIKEVAPIFGELSDKIYWSGKFTTDSDSKMHLEVGKSSNMIWFPKMVSCINGPYDQMWKPKCSDMFDYEGELVMVIGKTCRHAPKEKAMDYVAGFTVGNDGSVRDWQFRSSSAVLGKSWDTHGPIGPWIVTPDEIGNPQNLNIRSWVNGEPRQNGNTNEMMFKLDEMIEELSTVLTLEPGDLIFTSCPAVSVVVNALLNFLKSATLLK